MSIHEQMQQIPQGTAGKLLVATGGGGYFIQIATEWANIFAAFGNAALVLGGLYLMWCKIFDKRRHRRESDGEQ